MLAVRERWDERVREQCGGMRRGWWVVLKKGRREVDYEGKAVALAGRRYMVWRDVDERRKETRNGGRMVGKVERE